MGFERLGIVVSRGKYLEVFLMDVTKSCVGRDGDRDGERRTLRLDYSSRGDYFIN